MKNNKPLFNLINEKRLIQCWYGNTYGLGVYKVYNPIIDIDSYEYSITINFLKLSYTYAKKKVYEF